MKILLFADLHMCPRASIINKWGNKYPTRLENCISSINWVERTAEELKCDFIVNLGDFFDKPDLTSETITACNDIKWSNIMHYSLVGNHDASTSSLLFNSINSLLNDRHTIITEPQVLLLDDCTICFLPYITECDRKPLKEYFEKIDLNKPRIILSHNDISGIQMGPVISKTGFSLEEIEANCSLFINGHLHNGQTITPKVINLGNLTGKDFGEDALKYRHSIAILDTDSLKITYIENPYAYNFYKLQVESEQDLAILNTLKTNAVVSIKCDSGLIEIAKQKIEELKDKIIENRLIAVKRYDSNNEETTNFDLTVDHLARFIDCCKATLDNNKILDEELAVICN